MHPDTGQVRLAIERAGRRSSKIGFSVACARRSRCGKVRPLRVRTGRNERKYDGQPTMLHEGYPPDATSAQLRESRKSIERYRVKTNRHESTMGWVRVIWHCPKCDSKFPKVYEDESHRSERK